MASADLRDELSCSICLEVYTDPVTLRCGHNFCQACISRALDKQGSREGFSCPQCRMAFKKRPWLQKNVTLANIVERFQPASPVSEKTEVVCTYCIHVPVVAVKSCVHCEASLCQMHLKVHSKSPEHILIEPTTSLHSSKCREHKKVLEYYCPVESTLLCALSARNERHRRHAVQTLHMASKEKKDQLKHIQAHLVSMRQETQKRLEGLEESKKKASDAAVGLIQRVDTLFQKLNEKLDSLYAQTIDNITRQVEKNAQPASDLIQQLNAKIDEITGKIQLMEELSNMTDPLALLKEQESHNFCAPVKGSRKTDPSVEVPDEVLISLNLWKGLSDIWVMVPKILRLPERSELCLDKMTASNNVAVSSDFTVALGTHENFELSDTGDRFDSHQVLSRTSLSNGRHYWEVELCDTSNWRIGMSYSSIDRDGPDSVLGNTYESWCLCRSQQGHFFRHDGCQRVISSSPSFKRFKRLGIYLDYDNGRLSFYDLGSDITLLHTYYANFNRPLHAAFRVAYGVWIKIVS